MKIDHRLNCLIYSHIIYRNVYYHILFESIIGKSKVKNTSITIPNHPSKKNKNFFLSRKKFSLHYFTRHILFTSPPPVYSTKTEHVYSIENIMLRCNYKTFFLYFILYNEMDRWVQCMDNFTHIIIWLL